MQIGSLDKEDPLEEEMAPHSNTLAWEIPWTEEPGGLQSMATQSDGTETAQHTHLIIIFHFSLATCFNIPLLISFSPLFSFLSSYSFIQVACLNRSVEVSIM